MDLESMVKKGYSAFPKVQALVEPHYQIFSAICRTPVGGVLPFCRDTVGVFYIPSQLGQDLRSITYPFIVINTTVTQSGRIYSGSIYGSDRYV